MTIIVFLLVLSVLVLIHEFGHFFVAKYFKIKVEEFGFGIPPKIIGKKIGETIYSLNWLPIGGFVKLYGEDEAGAGRLKVQSLKLKVNESRAFYARPAGQRALVVVAGVVMNVVLAAFIFYIYFFISGFRAELPLIGNHAFLLADQKTVTQIVVNGVSKNSPAESAGIKPLAKIVRINHEKILNTKQLLEVVTKNKGKEIEIQWEDIKTGKSFTNSITPRVNPPKNEGALGINFFSASTAILSYEKPNQKILSGIVHPVNLLVYNFDVIGQLIGISAKEKNIGPVSDAVAGPIGVASLVGNILEIPDIKNRVLETLNLMGALSISLAFFNILPIPALDGGRLFFILFEMVTRKKVHPRFEALAHSVGMVLVLALIALIAVHDIGRIISGRFLLK